MRDAILDVRTGLFELLLQKSIPRNSHDAAFKFISLCIGVGFTALLTLVLHTEDAQQKLEVEKLANQMSSWTKYREKIAREAKKPPTDPNTVPSTTNKSTSIISSVVQKTSQQPEHQAREIWSSMVPTTTQQPEDEAWFRWQHEKTTTSMAEMKFQKTTSTMSSVMQTTSQQPQHNERTRKGFNPSGSWPKQTIQGALNALTWVARHLPRKHDQKVVFNLTAVTVPNTTTENDTAATPYGLSSAQLQASIDGLIPLLRKNDKQAVMDAVSALAVMSPPRDRAVIHALMTRFLQESDGSVAWAVAVALDRVAHGDKDLVERLVGRLRRNSMTSKLADSIFPRLIATRLAPKALATKLALVLGEVSSTGDQSVIRVLLERIKKEKDSPVVVKEMSRALWKVTHGNQTTIAQFIHLLEKSYWKEKVLAFGVCVLACPIIIALLALCVGLGAAVSIFYEGAIPLFAGIGISIAGAFIPPKLGLVVRSMFAPITERTSKVNAALALGEIAPHGDQSVIHAFMSCIQKEGDWRVVQAASLELAKVAHGDRATIDALIGLLDAKNWIARRNAAIALSEVDLPEANRWILKFLYARKAEESLFSVRTRYWIKSAIQKLKKQKNHRRNYCCSCRGCIGCQAYRLNCSASSQRSLVVESMRGSPAVSATSTTASPVESTRSGPAISTPRTTASPQLSSVVKSTRGSPVAAVASTIASPQPFSVVKSIRESPVVDVTSRTFIFVQRFPLINWQRSIYHTEPLICPRSSFSTDDQKYLDDQIARKKNYVKIAESWWRSRTAGCVLLGYHRKSCSTKCCSVRKKSDVPLNTSRAIIRNCHVDRKALFLYGAGTFDGLTAYDAVCEPSAEKCWSNWAGDNFTYLRYNCNTFTSVMLHCVYGLSQNMPRSDVVGFFPRMIVSGKCPIPVKPDLSNATSGIFQSIASKVLSGLHEVMS